MTMLPFSASLIETLKLTKAQIDFLTKFNPPVSNLPASAVQLTYVRRTRWKFLRAMINQDGGKIYLPVNNKMFPLIPDLKPADNLSLKDDQAQMVIRFVVLKVSDHVSIYSAPYTTDATG